MMEAYSGSIEVSFAGMPSIKLESFKPEHNAGMLERLAIATRRRKFSLRENWKIALGDIGYQNGLNGTVEIPTHDADSNLIVFDGVTIPAPWLVSLLTIGILRPLGVVLIGSIVHDYAYQYGKLRVLASDDSVVDVPLERHNADKLFRDIIGTVNGLPLIGYVAWLAVRIGWLWVPYNNQLRTGRAPWLEFLFLFAVVAGIYSIVGIYGAAATGTFVFCLYLAANIVSLLLRSRYDKSRKFSPE